MSLNPEQSNKSALRFLRNGELQWQQVQADGSVHSEAINKMLEQGRLMQTQLIAQGVVWVPTEQLVLTEVELPAKRRAEIDAALPYALEEQLAQPVEDYHFAILNRQSAAHGSILQVAAVVKVQMQIWRDALQQLKLEPLLLLADCFALPVEDGVTVGLQISDADGLQICRSGAYSGAALPQAIQLAKGVQPQSELAWSDALWCKADYEAGQWRELSLLNLAQGEFSAKKQTGVGAIWLWPNLAAGLLMATLLGSSYLQTEQAKQDAQVYQAQSEQLFRSMFPEVKRVVNLKAQTLSRLKQETTSQGVELMPLVYQLEPKLTQSQGVQIDEIRWNQRAANLELKVSAPQTRQLQQLEQQLDGMQAKMTIKNVTPEAALGVLNVGAN